MDHQKIREMLFVLDAPELSAEERREVTAHAQGCVDCRGLLTRWERIHGMFSNVQTATAPRGMTDRVINRLEALEVRTEEPAAILRRWVQWLYPTLGYAFAFSLMFMAIAHWEPFLNMRPSTEKVLLSGIPQGEQSFFTQKTPEIDHLFIVQ